MFSSLIILSASIGLGVGSEAGPVVRSAPGGLSFQLNEQYKSMKNNNIMQCKVVLNFKFYRF